MCNLKMAPIFFIIITLFASCNCNKYSAKMNAPEYNQLNKPFRMQKLNLIWERAQNKLPAEKLKSLHTDLKFQDKEELAWKKSKAEGYDKSGLKEGLILASFKAILEKYNLQEDFKALEDSANLQKSNIPELSNDVYMKNIFRDKKLNKLWLKAEQQGFSESQLQALKEEFQHHQNKIDQYYQMMNQLHAKPLQDDHINTVEHILEAEVGQKLFKSDNPHQMLKEKHRELKSGYEYLNSIIYPDVRSGDFEEPKVNVLWELAKNSSFSIQELETLKKELHHFEHRIKKLKTLSAMDSEQDDSNIIDEVAKKKAKKLKEYNYKVEKIQKDLTSRILQKHAEL